MSEIMVYADIGDWGVGLQEFAAALPAKGQDVTIRVNSYGGDAFQGLAMASLVRERKATIYVDGIAASAATPMLCAASRVVMARGAMVMLHNPWSMAVGDSDSMRHEADVLDKIAASYSSLYAAKTSKSEDEIRDIMRAETWLTADEAVALGIADEIDDGLAIAASAKTVYTNRREKAMGLFDSKRLAELETENQALATKASAMESQVQELTEQRDEAASRAEAVEAEKAEAVAALEAEKAGVEARIEAAKAEAKREAVAGVLAANAPRTSELEPEEEHQPQPKSKGEQWLALVRSGRKTEADAYYTSNQHAILSGR